MLTYIPSNRRTSLFDIIGLSTDTKPYGKCLTNANVNIDIDQGSTFLEVDTKKKYTLYVTQDSTGALTGVWQYTGTEGGGGGGGGISDVTVNGTSVVDTTDNVAKLTVINDVNHTTTNEALSANMGKELQDQVNNLKNIGRFLSIWNCVTGLPATDPTTMPYTYRTGDYYRVGTVSTATPAVNYKPNGSTYDGTASTTQETETVEVGAVYYFDGSVWRMQAAGGGGLVQDVQVNGTSILDSGSGVANIPVAGENTLGVAKVMAGYGVSKGGSNQLIINKATDNEIAAKSNQYKPLVPANLNKAIEEGLGAYNGTAFTDAKKNTACETIGAQRQMTASADWDTLTTL